MAFPDSNWPCGGDDLAVSFFESEVWVNWEIESFIRKCKGERNNLKSDGFAFAGAIWNVFASFDGKEAHSLFGINVRGLGPSDSVLDCCCNIKFNCGVEKSITFKFRCGSGDSYCAVEDFLSKLELDMFLQQSYNTIKSEIVIQSLRKIENLTPEECSWRWRRSILESSVMKGLRLSPAKTSTWPCGGDNLKVSVYTPEEGCAFWTIKSFLSECLGEKHELRSDGFSFAGVTWNLFASFDRRNVHSLFGISVQECRSSDAALDCYCTITFKETTLKVMKDIVFKFKCADSQCTVKDFLSNLELIAFLTRGAHIVCRISVKKSIVGEVSQQAEISKSSRRRAKKARTETQLQESHAISEKVPSFCVKVRDDELPMVNLESKVFKDLKNLLLSGKFADVTIQIQGQQFKAHRSILTARSSVFEAMFHHDTKEKATGVVNVEDCDPTSFPVFLEFLYCGSTEKLSVENVSSLYTSADKYDVQDLKLKCFQFIKSNLSEDIFFKALRLSVIHSEANLLQVAKKFFIKNCNKIISTPEWHTFILENPIRGNELFVEAAKYFSPTPR